MTEGKKINQQTERERVNKRRHHRVQFAAVKRRAHRTVEPPTATVLSHGIVAVVSAVKPSAQWPVEKEDTGQWPPRGKWRDNGDGDVLDLQDLDSGASCTAVA